MTEAASDGWPEEDQPIHLIKLRVRCADGKNRGGFFRDSLSNPHRWPTTVRQGLQEVMVCSGEMETGSWYLIEYVVPRQITGERARDSLLDEASKCCCRTPVQALHWFVQQAFGPPPALVERVREFAANWTKFCSSQSARTLLQNLLRGFVRADHEMIGEHGSVDLALLKSLHLVCIASGSPPCHIAESIVEDMGIAHFIAWTNEHLSHVAALLGTGVAHTAVTNSHAEAHAEPGLSARVTGINAAHTIGVGESTLSRWRAKKPTWARDARLFTYLMEREDGRYYRDRVVRLASWFQAAQRAGLQSAVDCP